MFTRDFRYLHRVVAGNMYFIYRGFLDKTKEMKFISDEDVLNNISDDMIYIRELVVKEKKRGLNFLRASHLGRLVIVFVSNCIEAHRDLIARKIGATEKTIFWDNFLNQSELSPIFKNLISTKTIDFNSLDEVKSFLEGLQALRDFISHGLVDVSAKSFENKMRALKKVGLDINPKQLTIENIDRILAFDEKITNLFGMAHALWRSDKNNESL